MRYHSVFHTFDEVLPAAILISKNEKIGEYHQYLLQIAAIFHDTGYLVQYDDNEEIGAEFAERTLSEFGFAAGDISIIKAIVLATKVALENGIPRQNPGDNFLNKIICDADLYSLGAETYFRRSKNLIDELVNQGVVIDPEKWWNQQIQFLSTHTYFTKTAHDSRDPGKQKNIQKIKEMISSRNWDF